MAMDRRPQSSPSRPFGPVSVGRCYAQTATDRFGPKAPVAVRDRERFSMGMSIEGPETPFSWPPSGNPSDLSPPNSIFKLVPTMQPYRNNLTALSQAYNLYFVAYQGHIYVYIPRNIPRQTIPRHPDLQLKNLPSDVSSSVGGFTDTAVPHSINHMITGFLGDEEIVVACFDDGDIIAYYIKDIAESVFGRPNRPRDWQKRPKKARTEPAPRIFFHENVGHSAWGLAVHRKSRLIAVSTNRYEVTVFAFALATCQKQSREAWEPCDCCQTCDSTESGIPRRARNWRIVVALGNQASNVPCIHFVDNEEGQAEKVCAVDIKGNMWLADIWTMYQPVTLVGPNAHHLLQSEEFWPNSSRGWGILPLHEEHFMIVDTLEELLGSPGKLPDIIQPGSGCPQPMANVLQAIKNIPDNPCLPPPVRLRAGQFYHHVPVMLHDESLHLLAGGQDGVIPVEPSDESEVESDSSEIESEEADEDMGQGSGGNNDNDEDEDEELESETENEQPNTVDIDAQAMAADGASAVLFPPSGLQFQQALQDLDQALGQLAYAVQEFQDAIAFSDHTAPALVPAMAAQDDQGSEDPKGDERSTGNTSFSGHSYAQMPTPPIRLDMVFFPHNGRIQAIPRRTSQLLNFLKRAVEYNANVASGPPEQRTKHIAKRYHFMRTYEKDVELRSLRGESDQQLKEIGVLCPHAVTLGGFQEHNLRPYFRATSRLSMILHVPELSLVIVGSVIGRVLLITPTKLRMPIVMKPTGVWDHGLRVEWILPRGSDEKKHRQTLRPFHGIAISPVQNDAIITGNAAKRAAMPRRYRLMLHYRTHDILTYEITREEQTGRLCIF